MFGGLFHIPTTANILTPLEDAEDAFSTIVVKSVVQKLFAFRF